MNDPEELPVYEDSDDKIDRLKLAVRKGQELVNCLRRQVDERDRQCVKVGMENTYLLFRLKKLQNQAFANGLILGIIVGMLGMMLIRFLF